MKKIFSIVALMALVYWVWIVFDINPTQPQTLKLNIAQSFGDSTNKGKLIGIQAFMEPIDYASEENFKEAAEAYEILSDTDKKAQYDRFGHQAFSGAGRGNGGGFNGGGSQLCRCAHLSKCR